MPFDYLLSELKYVKSDYLMTSDRTSINDWSLSETSKIKHWGIVVVHNLLKSVTTSLILFQSFWFYSEHTSMFTMYIHYAKPHKHPHCYITASTCIRIHISTAISRYTHTDTFKRTRLYIIAPKYCALVGKKLIKLLL